MQDPNIVVKTSSLLLQTRALDEQETCNNENCLQYERAYRDCLSRIARYVSMRVSWLDAEVDDCPERTRSATHRQRPQVSSTHVRVLLTHDSLYGSPQDTMQYITLLRTEFNGRLVYR